jgi:hypothetical protein
MLLAHVLWVISRAETSGSLASTLLTRSRVAAAAATAAAILAAAAAAAAAATATTRESPALRLSGAGTSLALEGHASHAGLWGHPTTATP